MKIPKDQIDKLSKDITGRLRKKNLLAAGKTPDAVLSRISSVILDELQVEDRLDEEVRKILEAHRRDIDAGRVDYNKMFQMIKKKLAEERNLIL